MRFKFQFNFIAQSSCLSHPSNHELLFLAGYFSGPYEKDYL